MTPENFTGPTSESQREGVTMCEGRGAIVTGAGSGIGAVTAGLLAARGASEALVDRQRAYGRRRLNGRVNT